LKLARVRPARSFKLTAENHRAAIANAGGNLQKEKFMIAAFLKDDDGNFNYPAALVSAFFILLIAWQIIHLCKSLKNGRVLFGLPRISRVRWIERANNPASFWAAFTMHCFGLLLFIWLISVISFGLLRK
jgi:hypothetical protein